MRFLIVQSGLIGRSDHFYNETVGWVRACERRGIATRLLVNLAAEKDVVEELGAVPACRYQPFMKLPAEPLVQDLDSFVKMSAAFALALRRHLGDVGSADLIVVPFATEREVYGMAQYLSHIEPGKRPRVMFLFHHPDHQWSLTLDGKVVKGDTSFCRYAALELARVQPADRAWYCATNGALARVMSGVMGVDFQKVPLPVYYGDGNMAAQSLDAGSPAPAHIGILGGVREEKGQAHLLGIINDFAARRPGRSVFVQAGSAAQEAVLVSALSEPARENVTVRAGVMSTLDFLARMRSLELLLLPYVWQRYFYRISSLFSEAAALGVPTVVPDRTWMARRIRDGQSAGMVFDVTQPDGVVEALVKASDTAVDLKIQAVEKSARWAKTQSTDSLVAYLAARAA